MSLSVIFGSAQTTSQTFVTQTNAILKSLDDGNGVGYRLQDHKQPEYGKIGNGAVDFSAWYEAGRTNPTAFPALVTYYQNGGFGATGRYAFVGGGGNVASANQATAFGLGNVVTGASAFAMGQGNISSGSRSATFNGDNTASGVFSFVTGNQNKASGNSGGVFGGMLNISNGDRAVILGGYQNNILTGASNSGIFASNNTEVSGFSSIILGSAKSKTFNNGNSVISSGGSVGKGTQTSIIASQSSEIDDPKLWFSAIIASNRAHIKKDPTSNGAMNQAIIASDSSIIYGGNPNDAVNVKWNNAIIASEQSEILAGVSYNSTFGKFTQGNSSAQTVVGILNEEFPHIGVTDPNKRTFVVGGGAQGQNIYSYKDPVTKEEWPRSYWNRRDVFYVQHNGKVFAFGDMNAAQYKLNDLNTAPASKTATGKKGEIRITDTHIYVCTADNYWKRIALDDTAW